MVERTVLDSIISFTVTFSGHFGTVSPLLLDTSMLISRLSGSGGGGGVVHGGVCVGGSIAPVAGGVIPCFIIDSTSGVEPLGLCESLTGTIDNVDDDNVSFYRIYLLELITLYLNHVMFFSSYTLNHTPSYMHIPHSLFFYFRLLWKESVLRF